MPPASKRRKRRAAQNQRNLERAKRKENINPQNNEHHLTRTEPQPPKQENNESENVIGEGEESSWSYWNGITSLTSGITQSWESAKDYVFPSRVLKRQLDDAQLKLKEMEEKLKMTATTEERQDTAQCVPLTCPSVPAPPPPPPPPPPPCIPPPPQPSLIMTRKRSKILKKDNVTSNQPLITLDSLKRIKLKSVKEDDTRGTKRPRRNSNEGILRVSMADLNSVRLGKPKRRQSLQPMINRTPEFALTRKSLRKVDARQSSKQPPLADCGNGITPMLARALRKKFEAAYPLSPLTTPSPKFSPVFSPSCPNSTVEAPPTLSSNSPITSNDTSFNS